jgi:hypothetical protein
MWEAVFKVFAKVDDGVRELLLGEPTPDFKPKLYSFGKEECFDAEWVERQIPNQGTTADFLCFVVNNRANMVNGGPPIAHLASKGKCMEDEGCLCAFRDGHGRLVLEFTPSKSPWTSKWQFFGSK